MQDLKDDGLLLCKSRNNPVQSPIEKSTSSQKKFLSRIQKVDSAVAGSVLAIAILESVLARFDFVIAELKPVVAVFDPPTADLDLAKNTVEFTSDLRDFIVDCAG